MNDLASIAREWVAAERASQRQSTHEEIARDWIAAERLTPPAELVSEREYYASQMLTKKELNHE